MVVIAGEAAVPPEAKAPESLAGTADVVEIPEELRGRAGMWPFRPETPEQPRAATTQKMPVMGRGLAATADPDSNEIAKGIAALGTRFPGNTAVAPVVPVAFPDMTVEHYAWLRAKLAVLPQRTGEILREYHVVHEATLRALVAHWEKELGEKAEVRAVFEKKVREYAEWLRRVGR